METDYIFKILLIGDSGVGKSSLMLKFTDDVFTETYISTIGVDFKIRTVEIDGKSVRLQIWDTAGQDRFKSITTAYYRNANGIMIVYDVTDPESYQNIKKWVNDVENYSNQQVYRVLVGNKADLENKRAIQYSQARSFADDLGIPFIETSAKTSSNVEQVFITMASDIKAKVDSTGSNKPLNNDIHVRIGRSQPVVKEKCFCS